MAPSHRVPLRTFMGLRLYPYDHRPAAFFGVGMAMYYGLIVWVDHKYKASIGK